MTSAIVRTNPTAGTATTSSVRENFRFAADEINRLLRANTDKVESTGTNEISAQFGNVPTFSLVDGVRLLIQIATTTTNATPTLNVNGTGNVSIKKSDSTDLAIGDLVAGGYYEFVYSSSNNYWLVLNLSAITSQDALLTTILGGLYPVGGLLTTTVATDPGDADYFFNGITFGTWAAYAEGRTIVGLDANDTDFDTVEETGGAKTHTLTQAQMNHNHQWHDVVSGNEDHRIELTTGSGRGSYDANADQVEFPSASSLSSDYYTDNNRNVTGESVTAHNNLQPYIVTYIWKRTA